MLLDTYSYIHLQKRRKTQKAFLLSLILHSLALAIIGLGYIQWYRPQLPSEPLVFEATVVTDLQRFHINSRHKRAMPTRRSTPVKATPTFNQSAAKLQHTPPASSVSIPVLATAAQLPIAEGTLSHQQKTEAPTWKTIETAQTQAPTIAPKSKTAPGENRSQTVGDKNTPTQPIDRDGQMGEALEGIAESVADGKNETAVDIVFLLDISGSMIDNIRAVGRQLNRMVEVFEEKDVDFTLGIVTFRYLDRDTIIHPQTRDSERYKRLLTSHVVAAAGDERAHNAIIKTMRRVNFREGVNRRFVLVTDEASKGSYKLPEVLIKCLQNNITIDVIGINHTTHKALTTKTGGRWFPIPIQE